MTFEEAQAALHAAQELVKEAEAALLRLLEDARQNGTVLVATLVYGPFRKHRHFSKAVKRGLPPGAVLINIAVSPRAAHVECSEMIDTLNWEEEAKVWFALPK